MSKMLGGLGPAAGLCCSTFWAARPVSIKWPRSRTFPLTPPRSRGICGRLMCCDSSATSINRGTKESAVGVTVTHRAAGRDRGEPKRDGGVGFPMRNAWNPYLEITELKLSG